MVLPLFFNRPRLKYVLNSTVNRSDSLFALPMDPVNLILILLTPIQVSTRCRTIFLDGNVDFITAIKHFSSFHVNVARFVP